MRVYVCVFSVPASFFPNKAIPVFVKMYPIITLISGAGNCGTSNVSRLCLLSIQARLVYTEGLWELMSQKMWEDIVADTCLTYVSATASCHMLATE